jgi:hypothetical protein
MSRRDIVRGLKKSMATSLKTLRDIPPLEGRFQSTTIGGDICRTVRDEHQLLAMAVAACLGIGPDQLTREQLQEVASTRGLKRSALLIWAKDLSMDARREQALAAAPAWAAEIEKGTV